MIKRCHSLKTSQINIKSLGKMNKESTTATLISVRTDRQNYQTKLSMHESQYRQTERERESPIPFHVQRMKSKKPLKLKVERSVETTHTTQKKSTIEKYCFSSSMKNHNYRSTQLVQSVRPFGEEIKPYASEYIYVENNQEELLLVRNICKEIEAREQRIKEIRVRSEGVEMRHEERKRAKILEKEKILRNLNELYLWQKNKNKKIMEQMDWKEVGTSSRKNQIFAERLSESGFVSFEDPRPNANFSFCEM